MLEAARKLMKKKKPAQFKKNKFHGNPHPKTIEYWIKVLEELFFLFEKNLKFKICHTSCVFYILVCWKLIYTMQNIWLKQTSNLVDSPEYFVEAQNP